MDLKEAKQNIEHLITNLPGGANSEYRDRLYRLSSMIDEAIEKLQISETQEQYVGDAIATGQMSLPLQSFSQPPSDDNPNGSEDLSDPGYGA